jgi:hypothetical protein
MVDGTHGDPPRRSALALSFGWMAVVPKLLRLRALSISAGGPDPTDHESLVPVICPLDAEPTTVWVPRAAVGSVFCENRAHWKVPMEVDPRLKGEDITPDLENRDIPFT